jgi:hypothetical protein
MFTPSLDLHGIRHHQVDLMVESFVYENQKNLPAIIICGNSNAMIELVHNSLEKIKCEYEESRYGIIRVNKI